METGQRPSSTFSSSGGAGPPPAAVRSRSRWRVGFLLPRLLVACVVINTLFRFAPSGWRPLEPGEGEVRHRVYGEAYVRNLRSQLSADYGDLPRIGNLQGLREYRLQTFTTDELGFRTQRRATSLAAVVFGDSFAQAGSDDETLANQLGHHIGCDFYNAASPDPKFQQPAMSLIRSLTARIPLPVGFVIMERVERLFVRKPKPEPTSIEAVVAQGFSWGVRRVPGVWRLNRIIEEVEEMAGSSPLQVLSDRAFRILKNDRILPNSYADNVVKATLRNGDWILFYPDEVATYEQRWPVDVSYWTGIAPDLARRGLTLAVVLVPNKYSVYHQLLADPPSVGTEPGEMLERVEANLRAAGIAVVNLTPVLRVAAKSGLERHEYVYWRDDTHWNGRGVAVAAAEIVRVIPKLRQACRATK
jgi:SGNH hydrolase-like domain, acetyltransferase AlgX